MLLIVCCLFCILWVALQQTIMSMDKDNVLIKFGNKVRQYRLEQGISQEELAFRANLHRTYIGMVERAERNITLVNIEKIANALNININDLFEWKRELIG